MRFFGFLAVLAVIVIAIGFWRGWFTFIVDRDKMRDDTTKAVDKMRDVGEKIREGVHVKTGSDPEK